MLTRSKRHRLPIISELFPILFVALLGLLVACTITLTLRDPAASDPYENTFIGGP